MTGPEDPHPLAERIATSVREQFTDDGDSRRGFLRRSALAGGTLLALGGSTGFALGQSDGDGVTAADMTAAFDDVEGTDIDVLNYALSLEHVEEVFYRQALEQFSADDFVTAEPLQSFSEEYRQAVFGYVETVGAHEATHVEVLSQAVGLLGGEPAAEGTYEFGVETVGDFLALGQVLENTGVAAYQGAAPFIDSPDLLSAALSIHSVEARHAALLNQVNGASPFPDAFDPAASQQEVLEAVSQFIPEEDGEGGGNTTATETPGTGTPTESDESG